MCVIFIVGWLSTSFLLCIIFFYSFFIICRSVFGSFCFDRSGSVLPLGSLKVMAFGWTGKTQNWKSVHFCTREKDRKRESMSKPMREWEKAMNIPKYRPTFRFHNTNNAPIKKLTMTVRPICYFYHLNNNLWSLIT